MITPYLNDACFVATYAGLGHDIGKVYQNFQEKLAAAITNSDQQYASDIVRHEIVSALILNELMHGKSWNEIWHPDLSISKTGKDSIAEHSAFQFTQSGIQNFKDAVQFVIATHHKVFGGHKKQFGLQKHSKLTYDNQKPEIVSAKIHKSSLKTDAVQKIAERLAKKINDRTNIIEQNSSIYWQAIALIARAAVVLADHEISSQYFNDTNEGQCYANTKKDKNRITYNQSLSNHLAMVGARAGQLMRHVLTHEFYGLSSDTINKLLLPPTDKRFFWQNKCTKLTPELPTLVFNVAATGAGKTRMNARTAAFLSGSKPVRLSIVLNLRSLTLQTGDVYKDELELQPDELSVIIGDTTTRTLHEYEKSDIDDNDIKDVNEIESIVLTDTTGFNAPSWLTSVCHSSTSNLVIAASPVLVSTVDYLIDAGDIRQQSSHPLALIRIMHSDLIIDEIDCYDPDALAAVLRVVKLSAIFGRHVIVSSATLTYEVAKKIYSSYQSGFEIYQHLNKTDKNFTVAIIDDSIEPSIEKIINNQFDVLYTRHIKAMMQKISENPITKKGEIIKFQKTLPKIHDAITSSTNIMHERHRWTSPNEKRISIGLIRVANIKRAIEIANRLNNGHDIHVCCYHARHFLIQRFNIESKLDKLLKRKGANPNQALLNDPDIKTILDNSTASDIKLIVIATPVEEIGRDHDFDWAIIEPSSAQSIVQTAGRVNRHRQSIVTEANIAILQYNFRAIEPWDHEPKVSFSKPGFEKGLERGRTTHSSHDLCTLINEPLIADRFDANVRFDDKTHLLSKYDNNAILSVLQNLVDPVINHDNHWMGNWIYDEAQLRKKQTTQDQYHFDGLNWYAHNVTAKGLTKNLDNSRISLDSMKGLFTLSYDELAALKDKVGITDEQAFKVNIYDKKYTMQRFGCAEDHK